MAKKRTRAPRLAPVTSLADLRTRAAGDPRYAALAIAAAMNLGGAVGDDNLDAAMRWLRLNAQETSEDGVVEEVNYCRDMVAP
jgi:hypothetical protein